MQEQETDDLKNTEMPEELEETSADTSKDSKGGKKFFKKETVSASKYAQLEESLKQSQAEIESLKDSRLRLMAEYDNYKRRTQKEKEQLYGNSVSDVTKEWLSVLDNLERAAAAVDALDEDSDEASIQKTADGVALISKQAGQVLEKLGVKEIEALGKPFDPELHEAVMRVDVDGQDIEPNTIVEVFARGYTYGDRVIRHSVVKVAN